MPSKQWKKETRGSGWSLGETANTSIGQGYVLTTPVQLAVMTARLANGEKAITPHLAAPSSAPDFADLDISPSSLAIIQKGMRQVFAGGRGTARRHDLKKAGIAVAGKSGTVQVKSISKKEREEGIVDNKDRLWKFRDHALFVAYAPYEKPRYAVAVVVEHGGSGSSVAAPIASKVLGTLLQRG